MNVSKNHSGYSMVEVLFASLIAGLVILFLAGQATMMSSKAKDLQNVTNTTDVGSMGVRFSLLIEFADASAYFSHLPIPTSCASDRSPCLRVLDGTNGFTAAGSAFTNKGSVSFVEFYRDDNGQMKNDNKLFADTSSNVVYSSTLPLDLSDQKTDVYATWPLVDDSSPPFPILHREGLSVYFGLDGALATSNPPSNYALLTAYGVSADSGDITKVIKGHLVVIFNSNDVKQFSVMKIEDIKPCTASDTFCKSLVPAAFTVTTSHYAIKMSAVSSSELANYVPKYSQISASAPSNWRGASDIYLFPTGASTLYEATDADLTSALDIRRWTHFYHTHNIRGEALVMPVELTSYKLVKNASKEVSYRLVKSTFGASGNNTQVEIDRVTGTVMLARKLGTKTISAFIGESL